MNSLPSSIETYFQEAGFSGTEIAIIKKLVEGDAMTLRDLAFKTGKSTGVLDQAMKKLLKKKIVVREMINGTPKYVLHSLESVSKWLQDDMKQKKNVLELRHQNFESFISSITSGKKRPEMQFFQGVEGLKKAYTLLLEKGNDFVQYGPILYTETEDPLREFNVQYFRERRKRNIFLRVIAHNTPLGRRFQNRDPFEYRKTVLVNENLYPFAFEKIVVGNTVACFQHETQEACFIEYKELAERERQFFERLWNMKLQHPDEGVEPVVDLNPLPVVSVPMAVPTKTKVLSQVREFFLSPSSIIFFLLCNLFAGIVTFFLYQQNLSLNLEKIQEKVKAIAATGAGYFDASDINQIQTTMDVEKQEYKKIAKSINSIINSNADIQYAYILRPTKDPKVLQFIIDVMPHTTFVSSANRSPSSFGDLYKDSVNEGSFALALNGEVGADSKPYSDDWGTFISGAAPIKNNNNDVIAIVGVDINASDLNKLVSQTFNVFYYFFGFFLLFIGLRFIAFNRSFV